MAGLKFLIVDEFGKEHTLSENVYVGPEQPYGENLRLWIDTSQDPAVAKYCRSASSNWEKLDNSGGSVTVSSVSSIPITSKLVIVQLSGDESLSVDWGMTPGQEIHLIISGSGNITIPNDYEYVNLTGKDVISVSDGSYVEINIISDGNKKYIRSIS